MIAEEDARIWDFVKRVNEIEARLDTLQNCIDNKTSELQDKLITFEKKKEEINTNMDEKIDTLEIRINVLENRRLGSDF